jgi:hypothetical protein
MSGTVDLTSLCIQRKQQQLFNFPLPRYTPISPYPKYTQSELNMRRKVEILKHSSNVSSSKTNSLTKKQKFSKLAKYKGNIFNCPNDIFLPTLSSSCDVPGPITILQNNPDIPLYNYATNTASYAVDNTLIINNFYFNFPDNVLVNSNRETSIALLNIQKNQNSTIHKFSVNTPFCFYIYGTNIDPTKGSLEFDLSLPKDNESLSVLTYYSEKSVIYINDINDINNNKPTYDYKYSKTNNQSIHITLKPPDNNSLFSYSAFIYAGTLNLSNINLFTQPGFVYDIRISFIPTIITTNPTIYNNNTVSMYTNITNDLYNSIVTPNGRPFLNKNPYNCVINNGNSYVPYINPSISGDFA